MLLPKGELLASNVSVDTKEDIVRFYSVKSLSGYSRAVFDLGEATLLFVDGRLMGCIYEGPEREVIFGEKALKIVEDELLRKGRVYVYACEKKRILPFIDIFPEARIKALEEIPPVLLPLDREKLMKKYRLVEPTEKDIKKILKYAGFLDKEK
jgi:hypothetical protein